MVILKLSGVWALLEHSALMKDRVRIILGLKESRSWLVPRVETKIAVGLKPVFNKSM